MTPDELLDDAYTHCLEALVALARSGNAAAARDSIIVLADLASDIGNQVAAFAVANNSSGKLTTLAAKDLLADMPGPVAVVTPASFVKALAAQDSSDGLMKFASTPPAHGLVRVLAVSDGGLGTATLVVSPASQVAPPSPPPPTRDVTFARTERDPAGGVHHIYESKTEGAARAFLDAHHVDEKMLYLHVDTPQGSWGRDHIGLFLEQLRPWQREVEGIRHTASLLRVPVPSQLTAGTSPTAPAPPRRFSPPRSCSRRTRRWAA